eukprot:TRINITY_DN27048_c0_g1_i2.p1 TRINITY_DN27048_c0_g1~~TRINITY_DN27048_c0_g1_i2.p1  ORF type:complete len:350 (-),score=55.89 TRINITY_DN27048_c0_g1_i2:120-1169(-)
MEETVSTPVDGEATTDMRPEEAGSAAGDGGGGGAGELTAGAPMSSSGAESYSGSDFDQMVARGRRGRRGSSEEDREQFAMNRADAVQEAVFEVRSVYFSTVFFGFILICIATYFEVKSIYILVISYDFPCDQPLWGWLFGHIMFGILREFCFTPMRNFFLLAHVCWTFYGFHWFGVASSCRATNPELYNWVEIVLIVAAIFLVASTLLPLILYLTVMLLIHLVNRGVLTNQKAAREGTLELLEVVTYDPSLFSPADAVNDPRPSGECCCCTENFDTEIPIVKTPCNHYYHKSCLGDWLKLARTCPLCRCDLEEVVWNNETSGDGGSIEESLHHRASTLLSDGLLGGNPP